MPKVLVGLAFLRVSQINGCAYCIDMHSRDLLKEGVTIGKLEMSSIFAKRGTQP